MVKKNYHILLDVEIGEKAKQLDINISDFCNNALKTFLFSPPTHQSNTQPLQPIFNQIKQQKFMEAEKYLKTFFIPQTKKMLDRGLPISKQYFEFRVKKLRELGYETTTEELIKMVENDA